MSQLLRFTGKDIQDIEWTSWIETKPQALHALAEKWFSAIKNCGHDVEDIFHDHYPIGCVNEAPFAYVNVFSKHVNIGFFYGADLPDERQLLEGTGKRMRHIKLKPDLVYDETAIESLIAAAYDDIKERLENEHLKSIQRPTKGQEHQMTLKSKSALANKGHEFIEAYCLGIGNYGLKNAKN